MKVDILAQAAEWLDAGEPVAVATIVRIFGSSSQPLGARMAITRDNRFAGAVSGGCVETDVYETSQDVLASGNALMLHYKHVENPLVEIGLNCEGKIDVLVEKLDQPMLDLLRSGPERHVKVTLCAPGTPAEPNARHAQILADGSGGDGLPDAAIRDALTAMRSDKPASTTYPDGTVALFEPVLPPPVLLIFGGDVAAQPLVRFAKILGMRTVVTDARPAFATREKHPDADEVIAAWPADVIRRVGVDIRTFVVSLNHEPRFEDALMLALAGHEIGYLGAIGKRVRHEERSARLQDAGLDMAQLPTIHTPIGLDIGGKSPEEIALSIIAEIVAVKNGRPGGMLITRFAREMAAES
jgi:xanthine dehydrogenase accessory factor